MILHLPTESVLLHLNTPSISNTSRHTTSSKSQQQHRFTLPFAIICILFAIIPATVHAQFYNGHQMTFGKSRVQYGEFYWQYFREPDFDIYYNIGGKPHANYVKEHALEEMEYVQMQLGHNYQGRIIFVIYNSLSDLRQSNIGLNGTEDQYNIGGTKLIVSNRVLLFFDGDRNNLNKQIRKGVSSLVISDILNGGGGYKEALNSSSTAEYPKWFKEGLKSYIANANNFEIEEQLRILLFADKLQNFNRLFDTDAIVAGHSLWKYIYDVYGHNVAANILSLAKLTRDVEQSFSLVLGMPIKDFIVQMDEYYKQQYRQLPDTASVLTWALSKKKTKKDIPHYSLCISPRNDSAIYTTNDLGRIKLQVIDLSTGKTKTLKRWGHKLEQIPDYTYPHIAWHPSASLISVFYEERGATMWALYSFSSDEWIIRKMHGFEKILSAQYSPSGSHLLLSGIKKGQTDIYLFNISSKTSQALTNDPFDEKAPIFSQNGNAIIYSSNKSDTTVQSKYFQLYRLNRPFLENKPEVIQTITKANSFALSGNNGLTKFQSDASGVSNWYSSKQDSSITAIDTAIHYQHHFTVDTLSASQRHLRATSSTENTYVFIKNNKRYNLIASDSIPKYLGVSYQTPFKKNLIISERNDSAQKAQIKILEYLRDSINRAKLDRDTLDIDSYVFLAEANPSPFYDSVFGLSSDSSKNQIPSVYRTSFYVNTLVNQLDFGFLNESYQNFTGGAVYFSPGMNIYFKMGVVDLFEDYRLTAGFRFSGNFDSNEYLFSLENFKKRLDKRIIFHRQTLTEYNPDSYNKVHDHELMYSFSYPFSEVSSLHVTPSARWDRIVRLAVVNTDLKVPNEHRYRAGGKIEYVFDNTFRKGLNLYNGIRTKVFCEMYQKLNDSKGRLFVLGVDYRQYFKIYRGTIFAIRGATSTSFGNELLLYYLGGVDNWVNVFSNYPTYNSSVEYDKNKNWAYQTTATNMRGFNQNVLNGNSFALFNAEIRWPVVKFFAQRPISSEFLSNFQIVGFTDAGTAWTGLIPNASNNAFNYKIIDNGPVTATIDMQKDPYVYGFGCGLRTRVFGYFIRADYAWGIEKSMVRPRIFYLSLSLDF